MTAPAELPHRAPAPSGPAAWMAVDQWPDRISVSSPIPPYAQLVDILVDHLSHDGYRPGTSLPTERALTRRFNLGRGTVRRALDALVDAGYAERGGPGRRPGLRTTPAPASAPATTRPSGDAGTDVP